MSELVLSPLPEVPSARRQLFSDLARVTKPRHQLSVSEWADKDRFLSRKGSKEDGKWRTSRNPPLREPMDSLSAHVRVSEVALMFPTQFGKTEVGLNLIGYTMVHNPGPIMVVLPSESSVAVWHAQKLKPMVTESSAIAASLTTRNSRDAANTMQVKEFADGIFFLEHGGSPERLKSRTVRVIAVDELDSFAAHVVGGDDPIELVKDRVSSYGNESKILWISSPQMKSTSRIYELFTDSDQRRYHVPCPHCGEFQHLAWSGMKWSALSKADGSRHVWYVCRECGGEIEEHHKTKMIAAGRWIAEKPGAARRGYHINALYCPVGLGDSWEQLVDTWLKAQGDLARLKRFINSKLAEPWEDKSTANVKANLVQERAQAYPLRAAPMGVIRITAGIDTQDDRLELQIIGWGRGRSFWVLDYVVLVGDPAQPEVWTAVTDLLNRPIEHASGALMNVEAASFDMLGHRTEHVKNFVRSRRVRRPMASFGATANTAPILGRAKLQDVTWRGQTDKRGVHVFQIGTVDAKHDLYAQLAADHDVYQAWLTAPDTEDKPATPPQRCNFSDQLGDEYFSGLISEVFNPTKNRFEKRRGAVRNEPLDTWVHAYAATHHPELRLHRARAVDWDKWEADLLARAPAAPAAPSEPGQAGQLQDTTDKPAAKSVWHSYRNTRQGRRP